MKLCLEHYLTIVYSRDELPKFGLLNGSVYVNIHKSGSSKSFPFLSPFQAFPFWNWERKGPFPVANWERIHQFWERIFPGKGSFPKIDESFPSCSLSWERKGPFPVTNRDIKLRTKFKQDQFSVYHQF